MVPPAVCNRSGASAETADIQIPKVHNVPFVSNHSDLHCTFSLFILHSVAAAVRVGSCCSLKDESTGRKGEEY